MANYDFIIVGAGPHPLVLMTWGESYHYRPGVR